MQIIFSPSEIIVTAAKPYVKMMVDSLTVEGQENMKYKEIPYVDKKVSRIFFGTAMEPFMRGEDCGALLDAVYEMGVNSFDSARAYGKAEQSLGRWLAERSMRERVILLSKCAHPDLVTGQKRVSEKDIRADFEESSRCLNTDFIDIYLLHRDDPEVAAGELIETFNAMHAEGKIGAFGGSNWTHERIEEANEYAYKHNLIPFAVSSPNFGLAEQVGDPWGGGCVSVSGPQGEAARRWYCEKQMPLIAYSSLAHGMFSGKVKSTDSERIAELLDEPAVRGYACDANFERLRRCEELAAKKGCAVSQIAMAWIYGQDLNTFAVVSSTKPERMQSNIDALDIELTQEELRYLDLSTST